MVQIGSRLQNFGELSTTCNHNQISPNCRTTKPLGDPTTHLPPNDLRCRSTSRLQNFKDFSSFCQNIKILRSNEVWRTWRLTATLLSHIWRLWMICLLPNKSDDPNLNFVAPKPQLLWFISSDGFLKLLDLLIFQTQLRCSFNALLTLMDALKLKFFPFRQQIILKIFLQLPLIYPIQAQCWKPKLWYQFITSPTF